MVPSLPRGWLSRIFATRRGRSRKTRSAVTSVRRRRVAAMEFVSAWAADGTRAQMSLIASRGTSSSWHSSTVSASAERGPPSTTPSSPSTPPGSMMASVSSPPSAERTVTLTRPDTTTITVSPGSLVVNTTWPRRKLRRREACARALRSSAGTERSRLVSRRMAVTSALIAGSRGVYRVAGYRPQDGLDFVGAQVRVLAQQPGHQAGHVRGGEGVAGRDDRGTGQPRHPDVDAGRSEVGRGRRVGVDAERILPVVGGHGDDRGELGRVGRRRDVVGGAHQDDAGERRLVGNLVEEAEVVLAPRAQRQVDHPRALLDRPAQARREDQALTGELAAEDPDRPDGRVGGGPPDDPGARGAVAEQVIVRALGGADLAGLRVPLQSDRPLDGADRRVGGIDPAVDHGHRDPGAGRPAPRPLLVDGQVDPRDRAQRLRGEGLAPCWS